MATQQNEVMARALRNLERAMADLNQLRGLDKSPEPSKWKRDIYRPKRHGKCATVWNTLDKLSAKSKVPTLQEMREIARKNNWNENNTRIEYYRWRNYHGVPKR